MANPDRSGELVNPGQNLGVGSLDALKYEKFDNQVTMAVFEKARLATLCDTVDVIGTNRVVRKNMGRASVKAVTAGIEPEGENIEFSDYGVTVDKVLYVRNPVFKLELAQTDISGFLSPKMAQNQAEAIAEQINHDVLATAVKAAHAAHSLPKGHKQPAKQDITVNGASDTDTLFDGYDKLVRKMKKNKAYEKGRSVLLVNIDGYHELSKNKFLVNRDYTSHAGDLVSGEFHAIWGIPVMTYDGWDEVCVDSSGVITGDSYVSELGTDYNVDTATPEAATIGLIVGSEALIMGKTFDVASEMWYNRERKTYMVDTDYAVGFAVNKPAHLGALYLSDAAPI